MKVEGLEGKELEIANVFNQNIDSLIALEAKMAALEGKSDKSVEMQELKSQIDGLKLSDLDLSDLNHTWSYADIIHSMANTDGYIYALVDYSSDGEAFPNESIELMKLFPSIYVHTLIRKYLNKLIILFQVKLSRWINI